MLPPPPPSTLFPYTTLFRSASDMPHAACAPALVFGADSLSCVLDQNQSMLLGEGNQWIQDRKSTRLNSSHANISYAVFCLKKKKSMITIIRNKASQK